MYKLDYIKESHNRSLDQRVEYDMGEYIQVFIKDKIESDFDIQSAIHKIYTYIPAHLFSEIDTIYIGMFDQFKEMETNAMYKNGAIYVSNIQDDAQDFIDDIIHEIAHSLEEPYGYELYGDKELEREFMQKREKLYNILKAEDLNPDKELFMNPAYTIRLDSYLYETVGYDRLNFIAASYGLFSSAYSATSLREYFANGFEYYFLDDRTYLREICPILYEKIEEIEKND
tara:strand:- start:284 stop:970 length:687 start_codon:yes stop_codon:yes gene_type:complete